MSSTSSSRSRAKRLVLTQNDHDSRDDFSTFWSALAAGELNDALGSSVVRCFTITTMEGKKHNSRTKPTTTTSSSSTNDADDNNNNNNYPSTPPSLPSSSFLSPSPLHQISPTSLDKNNSARSRAPFNNMPPRIIIKYIFKARDQPVPDFDHDHEAHWAITPHDIVQLTQSVLDDEIKHPNGRLTRMASNRPESLVVRAFIRFGDYRDEYINRDLTCRCRWKTLLDLFTTTPVYQSEESLYVVPIRLEWYFDPLSDDLAETRIEYSAEVKMVFHRIGTLPLDGCFDSDEDGASTPATEEMERHIPGQIQSTHEPMEYALLAKCPRRDVHDRRYTEVPQRRIHDIPIGDSFQPGLGSDVNEFDEPVPTDFPMESLLPHYQAESSSAKTNETATLQLRARIKKEEEGLPYLPKFTFQPYIQKDVSKIQTGTVHIALRYVNRLIHLETILLPQNNLLTAAVSTTAKELRDILRESLRGLKVDAPPDTPWSGLDGLFSDANTEKHWWIDLWVLPQTKQKDSMCRFTDKNAKTLKGFLDPKMVQQNDWNIYVEAHLVPK